MGERKDSRPMRTSGSADLLKELARTNYRCQIKPVICIRSQLKESQNRVDHLKTGSEKTATEEMKK